MSFEHCVDRMDQILDNSSRREKNADRKTLLIGKKNDTTPRKINMEHSHGGLEDHFPF